MASEIRVNKIENRSGLGTVTFADTGVDLAGIVTATTFSGSGASLTSLPAAQLSGTLPAISGANLTNLAAANLTGTIADARFPATLPAASAANLTSIPAANITGTLPALSAASLTQIPAANIVGVATAGFERSGTFSKRTIGSTITLSSQSEVDFTGFGSITRFDIHFNAVSTNGSNEFGVRLGTGGSVDTSGYRAQSSYVRSSDNVGENQAAGFFTHGLADASYSSNGIFSFFRIDPNDGSFQKWYCLADITEYNTTNHWFYVKGYRTLSGNLDIIRVLPENGAFDSGHLRLVTYTD